MDVQSFTSAAASGGTLRNIGARIAQPNGSGAGTTNNTGLLISTTTAVPTGDYAIYVESTDDSYFAGDIGVGATSPSAKLDVEGDTDEIQLLVTANSTQSSNDIVVFENSGGTDLFNLDNNGQLTLNDEIIVSVGAANDASYAFASDEDTGIFSPAGNKLAFTTGGSEALRIDASGDVSIGTGADAAYRLEVEASGATVAAFNRTSSDGTIISLQQGGVEEGTITVTGNVVTYTAFTGSHYGWTDNTPDKYKLVSFTGDNKRLHNNPDSEILYGFEESAVENDSRVAGAYLGVQESSESHSVDNPYLIMAAGNGKIWVAENEAGDLEAGDYLISSSVAGHAMKDTRIHPTSYVMGRAAEDVEWSSVTTEINGVKHAKVSVYFEFFERDNSADATLTNLNDLNVAGDALFANNVSVTKNFNVVGHSELASAEFSGDVVVGGELQTQTLTVGASASIAGSLTVSGNTEVNDLYINGKVITQGLRPTGVAGAAIGSGATFELDGTDTAGTVRFTTGTGSGLGEVLDVSFAANYGDAPTILLTPANPAAADAKVLIDNSTVNVNGFEVTALDVLLDNTEYQFNYFIIESNPTN